MTHQSIHNQILEAIGSGSTLFSVTHPYEPYRAYQAHVVDNIVFLLSGGQVVSKLVYDQGRLDTIIFSDEQKKKYNKIFGSVSVKYDR